MNFFFLKNHRYYDLVRFPHGHYPAPLISKLFHFLPIPAGKLRDNEFYQCPECGKSSFFMNLRWCSVCQSEIEEWYFNSEDERNQEEIDGYYRRWSERKKKHEKNMRWKRIEHFFLPILLIFGQVRYNRSVRKKGGYDFEEVIGGEII